MALISSLNVLLTGNTSSLDAALDKSSSKLSEFGGQSSGIGKGLDAIGSGGGGASEGLGLVATGLTAVAAAAVAAAAAIVGFGLARMNAIEGTARLADELGIDNNALIELHHAAEQSGGSAEALDTSLRHLGRTVAEAAHGGGAAGKALNELGLSAKDLNDLSPDQQLGQIADALQKVGNHGDQARIAFELFGREGGSKLLPMLKDGSKGLADMAEEAKDLGLTLSKDQIKSIENSNAAWKRMGDALNGIGNQIAVSLAPWVEKLADFMTGLFQSVGDGIADAMPYWNAFYDTVSAFWSMLTDMGKPVIDFIMSIIGEWNNQLGDVGLTWQNTKTLVLSVLFGLEYSFTHWREALSLDLDVLQLGFVVWGNNIAHLFTTILPTVFTAFSDFAGKFFTNLGKNVSENAQAIWDALKSGSDPKLVWHDLTEGFNDAMKKIDASRQRPMTDLEKDLSKRINDKAHALGGGMVDFVRQKLAEFGLGKGDDDKADGIKGKTGTSGLGTGEAKNAPALAGSVEAFKLIAGNSGDKMLDKANEQLKELKEQNKKLEKLLNKHGGIAKAKL